MQSRPVLRLGFNDWVCVQDRPLRIGKPQSSGPIRVGSTFWVGIDMDALDTFSAVGVTV